jgi:hypothetical protein
VIGEGQSLELLVLDLSCEYKNIEVFRCCHFGRNCSSDDVRVDSDVRVEGRKSSKKHGRIYTDIKSNILAKSVSDI